MPIHTLLLCCRGVEVSFPVISSFARTFEKPAEPVRQRQTIRLPFLARRRVVRLSGYRSLHGREKYASVAAASVAITTLEIIDFSGPVISCLLP